MQTLTHTFLVLQYVGLWRPVDWSPGWKSTLYNCYTWIMVYFLITVTLSELIELLRTLDDIESFANNSFMLLTMIGICGKAVHILIKRSNIIELTNVLQRDPCRAKNDDELVIQRRFDDMVRFNTLSYAGLVACAASFIGVTSIMNDIPRRTLPYPSWMPFDVQDSLLGYLVAFNHQMITLFSGAAVNVAFDTLVSGLMLQTCAQLNILKYRFHTLPQSVQDHSRNFLSEHASNSLIPKLESKLLSQRVIHHTEIFKFAKTTNDLFEAIIFLQCAISTVVLCASVLQLSEMKLFSVDFISIIVYLACMLVEIFIFCFYGCEVTIESMKLGDAVYEMDWSSLSTNSKTSLLTIMIRALRPIKVTSLHIVTLNLDSFNKLIKLSYSTYNVLQRSSS